MAMGVMLIAFFVWYDGMIGVVGVEKTSRKNTIFIYVYSWFIFIHTEKIKP